jgi:outer membrane protein assembly factor BamB
MVEQQAESGAPAAAVPLIDLDLVGPPDEAAAGRPPVGRSLKAAVLALVTVLTLTASVPPRAGIRRLFSLPTAPGSAYVLTADALFITDVGVRPAHNSTLRRFSLDGGAPRWSSRLPANAQGLILRADARVLLVLNADESTIAVDADSGRVLWRSSGTLTDFTADRVLLARYSRDRRTALLRVVSVRDGNLVWARRTETDATWRVLGTPQWPAARRRLILIAESGVTTTLRFDTGSVVTQAGLDLRLREWEGNYREDYRDDFTEISAAGDGLYVVNGHGGAATLTAYDGDTLAVRWRVTGVPPGRADDCGSVVCVADLSVFGADPSVVAAGREIAAVDPRTGAVRWTASNWQYAIAVSDDRLIATTDVGDGQPAPWALLDAPTGHVVAEFGAGDPLGSPVGDPAVQRFVHPDSVQPQRIWLNSVDLRTGRTELAGSIDRVSPGCDVAGRHIACALIGGPLTVWRLPG